MAQRKRYPFVSIPFKRESISKVQCKHRHLSREEFEFQFPSNGKAYPKLMTRSSVTSSVVMFQFPSNGKAYPKLIFANETLRGLRFNSLQTGKHIQSPSGDTGEIRNMWFQFPSNGKAYPKLIVSSYADLAGISFNSLQTGKHIQRDPILRPVGPWLRTPKTIRELRGAIFERNFSPKIPQTHVCIDTYAIF